MTDTQKLISVLNKIHKKLCDIENKLDLSHTYEVENYKRFKNIDRNLELFFNDFKEKKKQSKNIDFSSQKIKVKNNI